MARGPARDTARQVSQENVEIVRASLDAYNRRDFDALRSLSRPDLVVDWTESMGLEARLYHGIDETLRFYEGFFETFAEVRLEPDRYIEGDDTVVVPNSARMRGRDGIETVARSTLVFELRDSLIARVRLFQKTDEALEAIGLASPD
jgi:ketosteroid isomerase-like protein